MKHSYSFILIGLFVLLSGSLSAQSAYQAGTGDGYAMDEVSVPVGIEPEFASEELELFPNPIQTGNTLTVSGFGADRPFLEMRLFDVTGKEVSAWREVPVRNGAVSIHWPDLPEGLYHLKVNIDGQWVTQLIRGTK